jgi:hypothetical protein
MSQMHATPSYRTIDSVDHNRTLGSRHNRGGKKVMYLKGIVSQVREQLQWNPSDRSEEFRTAGAYFYSLLMPFSCFSSKKASVVVSHLTVTLRTAGDHSANDE